MTTALQFNPITGNFDLVTTSLPGPAITGFTQGSVVFADATGLAQDNSKFFWDDTNDRLGIGTNTPSVALEIIGNEKIFGQQTIMSSGVSANVLVANSFPSEAIITRYSNANTDVYVGADGVSHLVAGSTPYAAIMSNVGPFPLQLGTSGTVRFTIDASGNTGIGVTSPSALLDVNGAARIRALGAGIVHADASGNLTSSALVLTSEVSGVLPIANGGTNLSTYTTGDTLYASASNVLSKRSIGSSGDLLTVSAGVPVWAPPAAVDLTTGVTGTLPIANGGTGQVTASAAFDALSPMTTAGDIIIGGVSGTGTRLAAGTSSYVLTSNGAGVAPSWQAGGGGGSPNWARYQFDTTAGHASTNTACIYFANTGPATDAASLLTITNSSTNGFKILCNATVDITIAYTWTADSTYIGGITKNSTQLTTNIYSCTASTVMGMAVNAGNTSPVSFTVQDKADNTDFYHLRIENTSGVGATPSRAYVWIFARQSS